MPFFVRTEFWKNHICRKIFDRAPAGRLKTDSFKFYIITLFLFQPRLRWSLKPTHASIIAWHAIALVYYFYAAVPNCNAQSTTTATTDKVRLLDLSHPFDENTIYWVTAKKLNFTVTHNGTDPGNNYW